MREFEQMEMQFFVRPGTQKEWYEQWKETRLKWHLSLGLGADNYRFHDHDKLAHYADAAADIEFKFPFGFKELEGIHSRTDFDLKAHETHSGKKIQYFDPELGESYVPYVVETSVGLDRLFLAVFSKALVEEALENGGGRYQATGRPRYPTKLVRFSRASRAGISQRYLGAGYRGSCDQS